MDDDDFFLVAPKGFLKNMGQPKDYDLLSEEEKKALGPIADLNSEEPTKKTNTRIDSAIDRLEQKYGLRIKSSND